MANKRVELKVVAQVVYTKEVGADEPGALEEFTQEVVEGTVAGEVVGIGSQVVTPLEEADGNESL